MWPVRSELLDCDPAEGHTCETSPVPAYRHAGRSHPEEAKQHQVIGEPTLGSEGQPRPLIEVRVAAAASSACATTISLPHQQT